MLKLLFIIGLVAAVLFGGQWIMNHPGEVTVNWLGYDITVHVVVVAALLLMLVFVITFFSVSLWQVMTWPKRRRARKQYRTMESGIRYLTQGVTALAMGNESEAQSALKKAAAALPNDPLPQLLTAQLLQRQGKHEDARAQFRELMQHEATSAVATRRLIEQHVTAKEWGEAVKLAEEAREAAPKDRWNILTLLDLYARTGNTAGMLALTEGWQWQSPLSKEERHRYAAVAHYIAAIRQPDAHKKEQALRHAVGYAPDFLPAIVDFADVLMAENETRAARKWLLSAWEKAPNHVLIEPILSTLEGESPRAQRRLLKPFLKGEATANHHLLAAQQAFAAGDLEEAKQLTEHSLALAETKHACSLMAEIEKQLRGMDAANGWLARALDAPASETWVCEDCGTQHVTWTAHCSSCGHFDSVRYTQPEARITSVELVAKP